jgi:hypothetical protein
LIFFDAWSAFEVAVTVRKYLPCVPSLRNIRDGGLLMPIRKDFLRCRTN